VPTSDSYVFADSPNDNFGSASGLLLKNSSASPGLAREAYLKFDLTGIDSPIRSAKLRLFASLGTSSDTNLVLAVYHAPKAKWGENSITWNGRPSASTKPLITAVVNDRSPQWYELDLTSFLEGQRAAGRNIVTLLVRSTSNSPNYIRFNSKEAASNGPELSVVI
jgi:hyaluronate lyase